MLDDRIKDNEWWKKNENGVRCFFKDSGNRLALKKNLVSSRNFHLIEVVKRLNIFVEEGFIIDSLKIRSNGDLLNFTFYIHQKPFILYSKGLTLHVQYNNL